MRLRDGTSRKYALANCNPSWKPYSRTLNRSCFVTTFASLVRAILAHTGWTQTQLAQRIGTTQGTVSRWASARQIPDSAQEKALMALANELMLVETTSERPMVPLVGYVGAGGDIAFIDDHALGGGLDHVESPPGGRADVVAVQVRGDSMYPVHTDGDILYYRDKREGEHIADLIGLEVIARLADGRTYIKRLARGGHPGLWTLKSWNAPDMEDVVLEWAAFAEWKRSARR
jgi:DNA-binding transcriptional regulator YiaG